MLISSHINFASFRIFRGLKMNQQPKQDSPYSKDSWFEMKYQPRFIQHSLF